MGVISMRCGAHFLFRPEISATERKAVISASVQSSSAVLSQGSEYGWLGGTDKINELGCPHFCVVLTVKRPNVYPLTGAVVPIALFLYEATAPSRDFALFACSIVHNLVSCLYVA
jgi:hypothetical protein